MTTITTPTIADLTQAKVDGVGVFDVLMRANKAHLEQEFKLGRIKGPEYSTVYLGSLQSVLQAAITFLLEKDKSALQAQLLEQQILVAQIEVQKAQNELLKIQAEVGLVKAQVGLVTQQMANAVLEGKVLVAQECKLRAEYDLLVNQNLKVTQETALLQQKVITEQAQTQAIGVDPDSVIGKQKALYTAQTDGFKRDAEQKATKLLIDTWNTRRVTDEATVADGVNMLNDATIGRAVNKLLTGVGA